MKIIKMVGAVLGFCCMISCKPNCNLSDSEVVGQYYLSESEGFEQFIELKKDHSYLHQFSSNNTIKSHSGKWKLYKDCDIILKEWKFIDSSIREPLCKCINYNAFFNKNLNGKMAISFLREDGFNFIKK